MAENILVVEYEPRYTDRVKQALAGQPFETRFAKDGEEALRAIESFEPRLIVLSSVVPKVSAADLIQAIRGRESLKGTPILLTVSGYRGDSPRADAARLGASDILPKPYSENEFLGKVQQMLGVAPVAWSPRLDGDFTVRMTTIPPGSEGRLTSDEIFGELLDDDRAPSNAARKPMNPKDDVDKMLADTLAGMMPQQKKKDPSVPAGPTPPGTQPATTPAKPREISSALDKRFQDTLSGLEKNARRSTASGTIPTPAVSTPAPMTPPATPPRLQTVPPQASARPAAAPPDETVRVSIPALDRMPIAQPVFPAAAPVPHTEETEPADGIKFGQYVLLEKIATGGMAEVWKARMRGVEGFQKIVAIKKILPHLSDNQDFIEMFVDEAKLAAQLNHNNIIHIYDLGKIQSSYYIAMEYIDGYDLKNILKKAQERDQPLTVEIALFVASKVAAALDYAHRKRDFEDKEMGLVHRDVSPQNVLISQEGDIKLCDFGIAKAASKASHTQAGALKGKLQYMAPEQAWGRNIDRRSDIFALAAVLFEMLTARKLFEGDNELSILEQVREAHVTPPSHYNDEVTPQIDAIVLKALQKDPAGRYQTAGEMQRDLDAVLYNFRPTPTSADLAIYMHRLATSPVVPTHPMEPIAEPLPARNELKPIKPALVMPPFTAPATPSSVPAGVPVTATRARKTPIVPLAIAAAVVIAVIAGFLMMRKSGTPAAARTATRVAARPQIASTTTTTSVSSKTGASALSATVPTSAAPVIDPSKVNEEVQKRIAAEKARLEQLARAQNQQTAAPQRNAAAAPQPQPQVAQTVAPPTVENRPAPVPQPVASPPQPVAESRPAVPPEAPRTQVGDLVSQGAEGLTPPRVARQATAQYPPIARVQHLQGSVVVSALVNENGQVLETRVVTSASPIFNSAASDSIKRSTFTPATKDGVRVKSWATVRVDFKL